MSRKRAYILAAMASIMTVMAASCSRSLRDEPERGAIQFNVAVAATTRAHDPGNLSHPEDQAIGVWAFSIPAQDSWRENAGDAVTEMEHERAVHSDGNIYRPEGERLWAEGDRRMKFFACSPWERGGYDAGRGIFFDGYDLAEGEDLMFCETAMLDYGTTLGTVSLAFTRALCRVEFRLLSSLRTDTELIVRKLTLCGIRTKGDFSSLPSPSWTVTGPAENHEFFNDELADADDAAYICGEYLIPQNGKFTVELVCDIMTGDSVLHDQPFTAEFQADWKPGRQHLYLLKIGKDMQLTVKKDIYDNYD